MGYGRVSSLKMQMSIRDGESLKTRDYVFVVYVTVTKGRAGECGENGCRRSHHRLLHPSEEFGNREVSSNAESVSNPSSPSSRTLTTVTSDVTEGNTEQATDEHSHITTLTSAQYQEFVSLRTVPVWLSAKGKKIKVNAVLDDASTVSYVNEEVAGALGLSATYEKVTVNVLTKMWRLSTQCLSV